MKFSWTSLVKLSAGEISDSGIICVPRTVSQTKPVQRAICHSIDQMPEQQKAQERARECVENSSQTQMATRGRHITACTVPDSWSAKPASCQQTVIISSERWLK